MKPPLVAPWTVRVAKLAGAPYHSHTLMIGRQVILSRLEPISESEARDLVRAHLAPAPIPPVQPTRVTQGRGKPGPKSGTKSPSVNDRGFLWTEE